MTIPLPAVALALFINLLWGANVFAAKIGLLAVPPMWSAFWRFALGVACLWAWARFNHIRLWPEPGEWRGLSWLGALFTVQIAFMYWGIDWSTGAMASVLIATNPLFGALFSHLAFASDRLNIQRVAGLTIAFAGTMLVMVPDPAMLAEIGQTAAESWRTVLGNAMVLLSAALLGGRLVFNAKLVRRMESTRVIIWQILFSLPAFAVVAALTERIVWERMDWTVVAALVYQGAAIAGFAFMISAWLLKRYSPSVVMSFNFIAPVFGVVLSIAFLGEALHWPLLVGLGGVGVGLYLTTKS